MKSVKKRNMRRLFFRKYNDRAKSERGMHMLRMKFRPLPNLKFSMSKG